MSDLEQSCKWKIQDAYHDFKRSIPDTSHYWHWSQREKREPGYYKRETIEKFEYEDFSNFEWSLGKLIKAKAELEIAKNAKCSKCGYYNENFLKKLESKIKIAEAMYEHWDNRIGKLKSKYSWEHKFMEWLLELRENAVEEIEHLKNKKMVQSLDLKIRKRIFDLLASSDDIYRAKWYSLYDEEKLRKRGNFNLHNEEKIQKTKINDSVYLDDDWLARILTRTQKLIVFI